MVSLYFLSGIMLLGMGVLGVYIGRIFNQVKGRPLYIVSEMAINCSSNQEKVGG
jgi:dolichol-phosphate mannosyltransferase